MSVAFRTPGRVANSGFVTLPGERIDEVSLDSAIFLIKGHAANKERRGLRSPRLLSFDCSAYFLHPEQEAQHSAEEQHDAFAAFTAPAKPSAITATNRIALILFMFFLLFR